MAIAEMSESLLDEKLTATAQSRGQTGTKHVGLVYMQSYFVTIATILGTGVLGLPVTLSKSGVYPFLVSFLLGFFFQALLIVFFVDLLQRAHAAQLLNKKEEGADFEAVPLTELDYDTFSEADDETETSDAVLAGHVILPKESEVQAPNLHLLAELFLCCGMRQFFDLVILLQFISLLICYALAGSEAYAQVIGIPFIYVIPVFCWVLTAAIVFALQLIQPIVSILTFAKGSLLLGTVIVTFIVGSEIHHEIDNDFTYIGAPFLMGTVALGGVINVMPMLYGKVAPVRSQVRGFRTAVLAGLGTCAILNILWCWSVLDIVPQLNSCFSYNMKENNTFHIMTGQATQQRMLCYHNLSLEEAEKNGEISTIPLTKIIQSLYPSFSWVALLVELFIMISITVSYLTIGAALHHTLSGIVSSFWTSSNSKYSPQSGRCKGCSKQCLVASVLSLVAFTLVFCVAMYNPKSFAIVLEKAVSLLMNLEQGILVYFMIWTSLNTEYIKLRIPLPLPKCVYYMYHLLPVYFGFAVAYDIYVSTHDIIWPQITQYIEDFMTANLTRGNFTTTVSEIMSISTNAMAKDSTYSPLATTENSSIVTLHSQTPMLMTMTNVLTTLTNGVTASIVNSTSP